MELILLIAIIAIIAYFSFFRAEPQKDQNQITDVVAIQIHTDAVEESDPSDRYNDPDVRIIRDEIRSAVAPHSAAIRALQSIARMDGVTSEAERDQIFEFLNRQGAGLSNNKHRPWFYTSRSGEWYRAATMVEFENIILPLESFPLAYRTDVFITASAIVATGGIPKKRESDALDLLRKLIA